MGVTTQSFNFISQHINDQKSICELGDQQFYVCYPFKEASFTKVYWENKGLKHTYIDLHGGNGALPFNLSEDLDIFNLDTLVPKQYDIVTDFGTMEHVDDFYNGFKNFHKLCKTGGLMIHVLPSLGHWPLHGIWRAPLDFFIKLAKECDYTILNAYEEKTSFGGDNSFQCYLAYTKNKDNNFISREKFMSLGVFKTNHDEERKIGIS